MLGGFIAGVFFRRRIMGAETYEDVKGKINAVTAGFLAPVFFASIGLHLEISALSAIPGLLLLLILTATVGKVAGAGLPAYWQGLSKRDALAVGVGMNARGAVELIIADVALRHGLFTMPQPAPPVIAHMFSAVVIVAVVTTVVTPVLLRYIIGTRR